MFFNLFNCVVSPAEIGYHIASKGIFKGDGMIFYFSGTGNSLYVAREIASALRDEARSIPQAIHDASKVYEGERIGIVAPLYGFDVPEMVKRFMREATFDTGYLFFVFTYGNRHGICSELACSRMASRGQEVAYTATIIMVDNWLPGFDMDRQRMEDKGIEGNLEAIVSDLRGKVRRIERATEADRAEYAEYLELGIEYSGEALQGFLHMVGERCVGCGTCTRVCPAGCIALKDGRAQRDSIAGLGCNGCLACIHACSAHAIEMELPEINPAARFRNEHVGIAELMEANSQYNSINQERL